MTPFTEGRKPRQVSQKVSKELGDADLQKQKMTQGRFLMLIANKGVLELTIRIAYLQMQTHLDLSLGFCLNQLHFSHLRAVILSK